MRSTTERPEGVDAGTLRLVGTREEAIYSAFIEPLENQKSYEAMSGASNLNGDGKFSICISGILKCGTYESWNSEFI